jgi:2-polyprenyl-3-methyl-5-hydroxy-6-metoxy-1,4-benzoquinol methylase
VSVIIMRKPEPNILDFVNENGAAYLQYSDFNRSPRNRLKLACVVRMLEDSGLPRDSRVLEIGCGMGNVAIPLASLGYRVTAMDIHEPSLEAARRRNTFPNLDFRAGDALQFDVGVFDAVIMSDVLEHIPNCGAFLRRLAASMKPGAWFVLTVPNGWNISELTLRPSYKMKPTRLGKIIVRTVKQVLGTKDPTTANEETPHVNFFTIGWLMRLFSENAMEVRKFYPFFLGWTLWETLFSERKVPASWPENDFRRSMHAHPRWCAEWGFLARKAV